MSETHTHTHTHTQIYRQTHIQTHTHVQIKKHIQIHTHTKTHMYKYRYTYRCTHTHTDTHTCTDIVLSDQYLLVEQFCIGSVRFGAIPWKLLSRKPFSICRRSHCEVQAVRDQWGSLGGPQDALRARQEPLMDPRCRGGYLSNIQQQANLTTVFWYTRSFG